MATENYGEIYAAAIAESGMGSEVLPDGEYAVKIGSVKKDTAKSNSKFRLGIRLVVQGGPHDGVSTWVNQTFSPENPKAVAVFLRILKEFGVPQAAITAGYAPEVLADYIPVGGEGIATLGSHAFGTNEDGTPRRFQDVKKFRLTGAETPAAAPAPAAAAPVQEAVPAPAAPAPSPAPAPGSVPAPF